MKYGYIIHNYGKDAEKYPGFNVGDPIQTIAVEYLYDRMGINKDDRKAVQLCDLNSYDGEYLILPMCAVAIGIQFALLPLSSKIIPVFISTHIAKNELEKNEVEYLRKYEPIGCRDEFTLQLLRRYGILAYLTGCITAILPKRNQEFCFAQNKRVSKVFLVDIPKELNDFLPCDIARNAERLTHLLPIPHRAMNSDEAFILYEKSKKILANYRDNASLVISSRMHAIVPCMAMGIPVIAAFENISYRFSWLDKFIRLYSRNEFAQIDWTVGSVGYEDEKEKLLLLFQRKIKEVHEKYEPLLSISEFFENRTRARYGSFYQEQLLKIRKLGKTEFEYLIWGCGLIGNTVQIMMEQEYPKAKLVSAVDNYVDGEWHGVRIIKPNERHHNRTQRLNETVWLWRYRIFCAQGF